MVATLQKKKKKEYYSWILGHLTQQKGLETWLNNAKKLDTILESLEEYLNLCYSFKHILALNFEQKLYLRRQSQTLEVGQIIMFVWISRESFDSFLWVACQKCIKPWVSFLIEAINLLVWFGVRKSTEDFWDVHAAQ